MSNQIQKAHMIRSGDGVLFVVTIEIAEEEKREILFDQCDLIGFHTV